MKYIKKISGTRQEVVGTPNIVLDKSTGKVTIDYYCPLYLEALEDMTFKLYHDDTSSKNVISYSTDGKEWLPLGVNIESPIIKAGTVVFIKGEDLDPYRFYGSYMPGFGRIQCTGKFNVGGHIDSLKVKRSGYFESSGYTFPKYYDLFSRSKVVDASSLILEETTNEYCYQSMFDNCDYLTYPPKLPAEVVASGAYAGMFRNCSSLIQAPILPAKTLGTYCYQYMFQGCRKLNRITMLATDISATQCLDGWVQSVSSTGIFIKHPDAELPIGGSGIPEGWTVETAES